MGGRGSGGRNAKPTVVKKREGNRGHRKLNKKEPKAELGEPEIPRYVQRNPIALAEWRRLVPILLELGVLTKAHSIALGGLCSSHSQLVMAEAAIKKYGLICARTIDKESGFAVLTVNPAVRIKSDALRHLRAACAQFGLDPSSSSRVSTHGSTQDPLDDFFGGEDSSDIVQ